MACDRFQLVLMLLIAMTESTCDWAPRKDPPRHGWRGGASRDGFTACLCVVPNLREMTIIAVGASSYRALFDGARLGERVRPRGTFPFEPLDSLGLGVNCSKPFGGATSRHWPGCKSSSCHGPSWARIKRKRRVTDMGGHPAYLSISSFVQHHLKPASRLVGAITHRRMAFPYSG